MREIKYTSITLYLLRFDPEWTELHSYLTCILVFLFPFYQDEVEKGPGCASDFWFLVTN